MSTQQQSNLTSCVANLFVLQLQICNYKFAQKQTNIKKVS